MTQFDIDAPIHAQAFAIAMAELVAKDPTAADNTDLKEALVLAIIDLANAGQTSPEQLARYGVSRCRDFLSGSLPT